ncbi:MAG TPA: hypothetical protein VGJ60_26230 [Chloroflexota bacterium]|jgi:hypothetical protein
MISGSLGWMTSAHWPVGSNAVPAFAYQEPRLGRGGIDWPTPPTREGPHPDNSIINWIANLGGRVVFSRLRRSDVRLHQPIALRIEREDEAFLVASDELDVYGLGDTLSAALEDFELTLQELFERLNEPDVQLGPGLLALRVAVNAYVGRAVHT